MQVSRDSEAGRDSRREIWTSARVLNTYLNRLYFRLARVTPHVQSGEAIQLPNLTKQFVTADSANVKMMGVAKHGTKM